MQVCGTMQGKAWMGKEIAGCACGDRFGNTAFGGYIYGSFTYVSGLDRPIPVYTRGTGYT